MFFLLRCTHLTKRWIAWAAGSAYRCVQEVNKAFLDPLQFKICSIIQTSLSDRLLQVLHHDAALNKTSRVLQSLRRRENVLLQPVNSVQLHDKCVLWIWKSLWVQGSRSNHQWCDPKFLQGTGSYIRIQKLLRSWRRTRIRRWRNGVCWMSPEDIQRMIFWYCRRTWVGRNIIYTGCR